MITKKIKKLFMSGERINMKRSVPRLLAMTVSGKGIFAKDR